MQADLFNQRQVALSDHSTLLKGAVLAYESELRQQLRDVLHLSPLRHFTLPRGKQMSVASSNCGSVGWVSDVRGYRYQAIDPLSNTPWPSMPALWRQLANALAQQAGYHDFQPDCCLINRYTADAHMGLHVDSDEQDFTQPIVSFSLGADAVFLWGGLARSHKAEKIRLQHGDVIIWGGPDRLRFHGIQRILVSSDYPARINLTFRRAQ